MSNFLEQTFVVEMTCQEWNLLLQIIEYSRQNDVIQELISEGASVAPPDPNQFPSFKGGDTATSSEDEDDYMHVCIGEVEDRLVDIEGKIVRVLNYGQG